MSAVATFAAADARSIARDPLLRMVLVGPLAVGVVARVVVPFAAEQLRERLDFALLPHRPTLVAFLLLMVAPMLFGMLSGLMLLEERENGVLRMLQITPVSLRGYLTWRVVAAAGATAAVLLVALPVSGLLEIGLTGALPAVGLAALVGPVFALFFGAVATDRLEGLALMKAISLVVFAPLIAPYVTGPIEALPALLPTYWPSAVFLRAADAQAVFWPTVFGGAYLAVWLAGAAFLLERRAHRRGL
jgi:hypothetical protein